MCPNPNFINKWLRSLTPAASRAVSGIIATADAHNASLYLVGGPVRDLLLGLPTQDIDLVSEADAIDLATRAAHYLDTTAKTHPPFRTATILLPSPAHGRGVGGEGPVRPEESKGSRQPAEAEGAKPERFTGLTIDIATARTETYRRPGALPHVTTPATIAEDLRRRDFTINAVALRLNGPNRGGIIDPTNGRADLEYRHIRILHDRSFQDDPTRILRAARYAARLHFRIERRTLAALKRDTRYLTRVSGARLHHEFARTFEEPVPEVILRNLHRLGILAAIHPALRFERPEAHAFQRLRTLSTYVAVAPSGLPAPRTAAWPLLALPLTPAEATSLATRLALTNPQRTAVEAMPHLRDILLPSPAHGRGTPAAGGLGEVESAHPEVPKGRPAPAKTEAAKSKRETSRPLRLTRSALATLLSPHPLPAIHALAAATTSRTLRNRLLDYLTTARHVRPILRGDDLIALGIPEGPAVGQMLARLRAAKLDGEVKTKTDEFRLLRTIYKAGDLKGGADVVGRRARLRGKR